MDKVLEELKKSLKQENPKDVLYDYLLLSLDFNDKEIDVYRQVCIENGFDTDVSHWEKYITCFGNFWHFKNIITFETL